MKKTMISLSGIKSACFMLLACLTLSICATSCSSDEFETDLPEESQQLSKAELIQQALSRIPQSRAAEPYPVVMLTIKPTVNITCYASENVVINWGDGDTTLVSPGDPGDQIHTYSDNEETHAIYLETSNESIINLWVHQNGLIFLDVINNTNLLTLLCSDNELDYLDLTDCPNLMTIWADNNNLSSIDLTHLPHLSALLLSKNQFTAIDVSKNPELQTFWIGDNPITDLDLTKNTALESLAIIGLPIRTINNLPISARSFAAFPQLEVLDVSKTPFTSLDFSDNPFMNTIVFEGTSITQLDISNLQIEVLDAKDSQLTKLIYTYKNLQPYCSYINILGTPFEELASNVRPLITVLPDRTKADKYGHIVQGRLYTTSTSVTPFVGVLTGKNWVVKTSDVYSLNSVLPTITEMERYGHLIPILAGRSSVKP